MHMLNYKSMNQILQSQNNDYNNYYDYNQGQIQYQNQTINQKVRGRSKYTFLQERHTNSQKIVLNHAQHH